MAISKRARELYNAVFDGMELCTANTIQKVQEQKLLRKYAPKESCPPEYAKAYRKFWGKYGNYSPMWGWYYASRNGNMDVRYVPHTLYYTKIDQHFNQRKLGWGFNDKNYYGKIFSDIPQPRTLVRKIGTLLFDENYKQISVQIAMGIIEDEEEIIVKPSQESGSGRGITFFRTDVNKKELVDFLKNKKKSNYIIQALVQQHPDLNKIYSNSLNTIRVSTILLEDGVHVLSSVLRMGKNNSRIDNASNGGISIGIQANGKLNPYAYILFSGEKTDHHPQGFRFAGFEIPEYKKIINTVTKIAQYTGNFRLVSWDMAVDENGEVLLIEANMRKGGIAIHQFNNGPLFGNLTETVLREVLK